MATNGALGKAASKPVKKLSGLASMPDLNMSESGKKSHDP